MSDVFRLYDVRGKDGYPPEWHATIKHLVREEAGHRCVRCHHPYPPGIAMTCPRGEWTPCDEHCTHGGAGRVLIGRGSRARYVATNHLVVPPPPGALAHYRILTVHHLDGSKLNCRWWNLAALCQRCHLQIQGKVKMLQTYPFEHSTWFKPYVAGFYAFTYLGEELTRAETIERLDELLGLERVS